MDEFDAWTIKVVIGVVTLMYLIVTFAPGG